jgi:hypothetical protein
MDLRDAGDVERCSDPCGPGLLSNLDSYRFQQSSMLAPPADCPLRAMASAQPAGNWRSGALRALMLPTPIASFLHCTESTHVTANLDAIFCGRELTLRASRHGMGCHGTRRESACPSGCSFHPTGFISMQPMLPSHPFVDVGCWPRFGLSLSLSS